MFTLVQRLAEEHHVTLRFQLLDDAGHHFDGEAVAKVAQNQANQIGGIGPEVGGGHVVDVAQLVDGGLHFFDGRIGDFSFLT